MANGFIPNQFENTGLYIGTTDVWEVSRLEEIDVNSQEFKLLLVRLYQNINNIATALNLKDSAYYVNQQFLNGQKFFPALVTTPNAYRVAYRFVVNTGALGAGVTTVAHTLPIDVNWQFTRIYGVGSNTATLNYYPIPFAGAAGTFISVIVNATNVVINNGSGVTFDKSLVVLEFLKN